MTGTRLGRIAYNIFSTENQGDYIALKQNEIKSHNAMETENVYNELGINKMNYQHL